MDFQSRGCPAISGITRVTVLMHTARKSHFPLGEHSLVLAVTQMRLENWNAPSKPMNHDEMLWMLGCRGIIQLEFPSRRCLHGSSSLCPPAILPSWSVFSSSLSPLVFQKSRRRNEWLRGNSHAKPKTVSTKLTRGLGATTCAGKLEGAQLFNQKYTLAWEISSVGGFAQFSDIDSPPFFKSRLYF